MPLKGFAISIDALIALAIVAAALSTVLLAPASDVARIYNYPLLARDYLDVKYPHNSSITPQHFFNVTGINVTETAPASGEWAFGEKFFYPPIANCTNYSACSFADSSFGGSLLSTQDLGQNFSKRAWVKT